MNEREHDTSDQSPTDAAPTDAPMDQVSSQPEQQPEEPQNPPLPDWGPTDGEHGTDAEAEATD